MSPVQYGKHTGTKETPQSQPIPGTSQVKNSAGGFAWQVDDWTRLERFLILGNEGGSYYASEQKMSRENAKAAEKCLKTDGKRVVQLVVDISKAGRAAKNDPAIFVLAMAMKLGDELTKKAAREALPEVCRIGTHLFHFAQYLEAFGGWGRGTKRAVANWYNNKAPEKLAYQVVKYQSRDGWSHQDLLRLAHVKPVGSPHHNAILRWVAKGRENGLMEASEVPKELQLIWAFEKAKAEKDVKEIVKLIQEYNLPREAIPTQFLNEVAVWEAMLPNMPMTAMIRNLGTMSKIGFLKPMSAAAKLVVKKLADEEVLKKARVHPVAVLSALKVYESGRGVRGSATWSAVPQVVDALDGAFYKTFQNVEPAGKRTLFCLDVSSSMNGGEIAGVPGLTPRVGSAAMAMVTARTEPEHGFVAFTCSNGAGFWGRGEGVTDPDSGISVLTLSPRQRLDDIVKQVSKLNFGGTDCALPMRWALKHKQPVDTFIVYTDSETWAGSIHPSQALKEYRQKMGIPAKLVVVAMVSNGFSIADPNDGGMMDCVGFDTNAPVVINDFSRGKSEMKS